MKKLNTKKIVGCLLAMTLLFTSNAPTYAANEGSNMDMPVLNNRHTSDEDYTKRIGLGIVPDYMKATEAKNQSAYEEGLMYKEQNKGRGLSVFVDNLVQPSLRTRMPFSFDHEEMTGFTHYKQYNYNDLMSKVALPDGRPATIATVGCLLTSFTNAYNKYTTDQLTPSEMMNTYGYLGSNSGIIDSLGYFLWGNADALLQHKTGIELYYYVHTAHTTSQFENILLSHLQKRQPTIVGLKKGNRTHYVLCVGFRKNPDDDNSYYYYLIDPDREISSFRYDGYPVLGSYITRGWDIIALAAFK